MGRNVSVRASVGCSQANCNTLCRYPTGHYVRTLGETGDKNVEAEALCIDHEVDTRAFSQKVINCLPPKTWVVSAPSPQQRSDQPAFPL